MHIMVEQELSRFEEKLVLVLVSRASHEDFLSFLEREIRIMYVNKLIIFIYVPFAKKTAPQKL